MPGPASEAAQTRDARAQPARDAPDAASGDHNGAVPVHGPDPRDPGPPDDLAEAPAPEPSHPVTLMDRLEAFAFKLSQKNNFWHRICSFIWLPIAWRSGIKVRRREETFTAILPFRRFNRNWYNAMAGAALLANSEVAGGMYVFKNAGKDWTVVCKELHYKFMRPCVGPAVYRVEPKDDVKELVKRGSEFNVDVVINIFQGLAKVGEREKRVGVCHATFHAAPKHKLKERQARLKKA